ncbi:MAG: hypothetical protein Q4P13_07055 [Psychrobacter sp.]|nr:hypothetical protein [Psychrobacter sp.]
MINRPIFKKAMASMTTSTAILATLALSGCATTAGTGTMPNAGEAITTANAIGMNVFKAAVDTTCRSEIEKQNAWRIAKIAMSSEQQENVKTKVCGCVSEQAPQKVTIIDMGNAAIDPAYRTQLVTRVVASSIQSCYGSIVK